MQAKRAQVLEQMRQDRNIAPAPEKSPEPKEPTRDVPVPSGDPTDSVPKHPPTGVPSDGSPDPALQARLAAREKEVEAAQKRVLEAQTLAEQRTAQAAKDEAEAKKALEELAQAKHEPMEFLAKVGMTKAEWEHFVQMGGKMSPEARKLKAMDERLASMDKRYEELARKAAESELKARTDLENSVFEGRLNQYTFVSKIGGLVAVRNKQAQIQNAERRTVSLNEAADLVEKEIADSLGPLLKHTDVRAKLGLDNRDQPAPSAQPKTKTLNGSENAKSQSKADTEEEPSALDWAAKKRKVLKLLAANSKR